MSEETKQKIMDGARKSLIKEGHRRSTIKVIAGYARVNHGLVHHYFGSKEELMVALIQHQAQQVLHVLFRDYILIGWRSFFRSAAQKALQR